MKALVIYDTSYGNTSLIAEAIARGLGAAAHAADAKVGERGGVGRLAGGVRQTLRARTQAHIVQNRLGRHDSSPTSPNRPTSRSGSAARTSE